MKYIVDFDLFEAAMHFAAKQDVRFYLNGVHLCKNRIEATNGHIGYMAKIDLSRELPEQIKGTLRLPDLIVMPKNKLPTKTRKNCICYCSISIGDVSRIDYLNFWGGIVSSDILDVIDGKFPNLAKLFSEHKKKDRVDEFFGVNADYLAIFSKVLKRESLPSLIVHPKASDESILVEIDRIHTQAKEMALIMPIRTNRNKK